MYKSNNLDFPVHEYPQFNLNDKDESECKADFRFEKNDLNAVAEALQIPDIFKCKQGTVCDGMNGLCIVLKRLAYPTRYSDMIPTFGMSVPELCMILNTVIDHIYEVHGHHVTLNGMKLFSASRTWKCMLNLFSEKGQLWKIALVLWMELCDQFAVRMKNKELFTMGIREFTV